MSSSSAPLLAGQPAFRVPTPRARHRPTLLLGARLHQPLAWWTDPLLVLGLIVLPVFCLAAYYNRFNYAEFNASRDFVTPLTFRLGLLSLACLAGGIMVGRLLVRRQDMVSVIDAERATAVLVRVGWIAIAAYFMLLGTVVFHLGLVLDLFRGSATAGSDLRAALGQVPGVTSFVQFGTVYLALVSALVTMTEFRMTPRLWTMTAVILVLVFVRMVLGSERLALLEALAASLVVPLAYRWRPSLRRAAAPYLGALFVFLSFAAAEYFRSWQYHQDEYPTYLDFILPRFAGYFSTAINNGAGAYLTTARFTPHPEITVGWVTKFPVLGDLVRSPDSVTIMDNFLNTYATPEFNNPGGLYAAFLDYPIPLGILFLVGIGTVIGAVHRLFQNRTLIGMLLYPSIFLGMTDLIRIMYISDTRTLPLFLGAGAVWWALRPVQMPRGRFLSAVAGAGAGGRVTV
jgi:hypothetical protein